MEKETHYIYTYTRDGQEYVTPSLKVASVMSGEDEPVFKQEITSYNRDQ